MAITRCVTDPSGMAVSRAFAVQSMIREVEHFKAIKTLLEKAQDQLCQLVCTNDQVRDAYVALEEAQDFILRGKSEKESSLDNEQAMLKQLLNASDLNPMTKHELYVCIQRLRAYQKRKESEEDSDYSFDNKNDEMNN
ncbi:hypothetical protein RJ035_001508 [Blastomyces gilchristii]